MGQGRSARAPVRKFRHVPGGVSPPVAASSVAPIEPLSGLPASLPPTTIHPPDHAPNLRTGALALAPRRGAQVAIEPGGSARVVAQELEQSPVGLLRVRPA